MSIDFSIYNNVKDELNSQQGRIQFLITKLRESKQLPVKEMQHIMPFLWEVEQKCKRYDALQSLPNTNYIIEILKQLETERFEHQKRNDGLSSEEIITEQEDELLYYI